jgi:hypothetical protein
MQIARLSNLNSFTTLDGSAIRELAGWARRRLKSQPATA